ncbi:unnamed protein product [Adineta steineri]|uniref:Uncharacterized protein n=1 Tax=Adineta steineri TaxID=433720 RepID=A0A813NHB8_9BILA|nr:unnamed protein product [Adineta steineri]CAF0770089.1 unnamed protein product [Adineta steineri]
MFRNVTGAQEAVVHRQSEDSVSYGNSQIKLIKDIQSDDIAHEYTTLKTKWFDKREELKRNLKYLKKHNGVSHEIQHVKNLIQCLNELIENGEVTTNCQTLINDIDQNIQPLPETYKLIKKPLGDKMIRLPRHTSKITMDRSDSLKKISRDSIHVEVSPSNEKINHQNDPQVNIERQQSGETTTASVSTEKMTTGIQFYVIDEHFRTQNDTKKTEKKYYFASSVME